MGNQPNKDLLLSNLVELQMIQQSTVPIPPQDQQRILYLPNLQQIVTAATKHNLRERQFSISSDESFFRLSRRSSNEEVMKDLSPKSQEILNRLGKFKEQGVRGQKRRPYLMKNNICYSGEWINRTPYGLGQLIFPDGSYYQGYFMDGFMTGKGRFIFSNGNNYIGDFLKGKATGFGVYYQSQPLLKYQGQFFNNKFHGSGTLTRQKDLYRGAFQEGMRKIGILQWGNHLEYKYQGQFIDNMFWGNGTLKVLQGVFNGTFVNGKKQGQGTLFYTNGYRYKGQYINDIKNGTGTLYNLQGGIVYSGYWQLGLPQGIGKGFVNNQYLQGVWQNGRIIQIQKVN